MTAREGLRTGSEPEKDTGHDGPRRADANACSYDVQGAESGKRRRLEERSLAEAGGVGTPANDVSRVVKELRADQVRCRRRR